MLLTTLGVHNNQPFITVKLILLKVIMFHQNKELLPPGDYSDLSTGNNEPNESITLVYVGIPFRNQLGWDEVVKEN